MVESTNVGPHGLADSREETAMRISRTLAALTVTCAVLLTTAATTATAGTTAAATGEPYCAITWATAFTTATCGTGWPGSNPAPSRRTRCPPSTAPPPSWSPYR
ncbi:hypothetical protein ACGFIK_12080 [Micromonospora sp. NPDC048871]|uniref:hypothetical protein n=1 Tax=Micromonospora sp. NPDC048871 TaxID=3364259 RepID=UPI0037164E77